MYIKKTGINLHGVELILGEEYVIGRKRVKLIQVTEYGYNFLNEKTNQCVLKRHLYVPVKIRDEYKNEIKYFNITDKMPLGKVIKKGDKEYVVYL
jgi:hypothetical protein